MFSRLPQPTGGEVQAVRLPLDRLDPSTNSKPSHPIRATSPREALWFLIRECVLGEARDLRVRVVRGALEERFGFLGVWRQRSALHEGGRVQVRRLQAKRHHRRRVDASALGSPRTGRNVNSGAVPQLRERTARRNDGTDRICHHNHSSEAQRQESFCINSGKILCGLGRMHACMPAWTRWLRPRDALSDVKEFEKNLSLNNVSFLNALFCTLQKLRDFYGFFFSKKLIFFLVC